MRTQGEGIVHRWRTEASGDSRPAHRGGSGLQKYEKILDKQNYGSNSPLATVGKGQWGAREIRRPRSTSLGRCQHPGPERLLQLLPLQQFNQNLGPKPFSPFLTHNQTSKTHSSNETRVKSGAAWGFPGTSTDPDRLGRLTLRETYCAPVPGFLLSPTNDSEARAILLPFYRGD